MSFMQSVLISGLRWAIQITKLMRSNMCYTVWSGKLVSSHNLCLLKIYRTIILPFLFGHELSFSCYMEDIGWDMNLSCLWLLQFKFFVMWCHEVWLIGTKVSGKSAGSTFRRRRLQIPPQCLHLSTAMQCHFPEEGILIDWGCLKTVLKNQ